VIEDTLSDNDPMPADSTGTRARRVTVRRFATAAEADRHDLEYWQQLSPAQRILQTWRLSQELWQLRGDPPDEPGLSRSVARIRRR
jgi:hypothetical protein